MSGYNTQYGPPQGYPNDPFKTSASSNMPPPQAAYHPPPQAAYHPHQPMAYPQYAGYENQSYGTQPVNSAPLGSGQAGTQLMQDETSVHMKNDTDNIFGASFSDKAIRRRFITKVYIILFAQLLVTFGFICLFIFVTAIKIWVQQNMWFYIISYVLFLALYISLVCCKNVRRSSPGNWICLLLFTLSFSYVAATISSFHDTEIVLMAVGITTAVCLAISLFAIQTKIDFTMCSGLLFALTMVLFFFGFACLITYYAGGPGKILSCVYGAIAALLFGLFLIYDTQLIMGGRKYELSAEEYIYGALQLYLDIVNLFLIILSFMGYK